MEGVLSWPIKFFERDNVWVHRVAANSYDFKIRATRDFVCNPLLSPLDLCGAIDFKVVTLQCVDPFSEEHPTKIVVSSIIKSCN